MHLTEARKDCRKRTASLPTHLLGLNPLNSRVKAYGLGEGKGCHRSSETKDTRKCDRPQGPRPGRQKSRAKTEAGRVQDRAAPMSRLPIFPPAFEGESHIWLKATHKASTTQWSLHYGGIEGDFMSLASSGSPERTSMAPDPPSLWGERRPSYAPRLRLNARDLRKNCAETLNYRRSAKWLLC